MADFKFDIYGGKGYEPPKSYKDVYKPVQRPWFAQTPVERAGSVASLQNKLAAIPPMPRQAQKGVLGSMLGFITGVLNIPNAMVSGIAEQLLDKTPGFDAQQYLSNVFTPFLGGQWEQQASWSKVIHMLADDDNRENLWDNKWVLIFAGLALDFVLDPMSYTGLGFAKGALGADDAMKVAGIAREAVFDTLAKTGKTEASKILARTFDNAFKAAVGQKFGFKLPWKTTLIQPFGKIAGEVSDIAKVGVKTLAKESPEISKLVKTALIPTFSNRISDLVNKIPVLRNGVNWFREAFAPYKQAQKEVIRKVNQTTSKNLADATDLQKVVNDLSLKAGLNPADSEKMMKYLVNLKGVAYRDGAAVEAASQKAGLIVGLIKRARDVEDFATPDFLEDLVKVNGQFQEILTEEIQQILRSKADSWILRGMKKEPKAVPVSEILEASKQWFDDVSIKQLERTFTDMGIIENFPDLYRFAGFQKKSASLKKTFTEAFRESFEKSSPAQKDLLNSYADKLRMVHDKLDAIENANGIPHQYIRDYMTFYIFPKKEESLQRAIGTDKRFFQYLREADNPEVLKNRLAARMVRSGHIKPRAVAGEIDQYGNKIAKKLSETGKKSWNEAIEKAKTLLTSKGGDPVFGKVLSTVEEATYIRILAHQKAMHKNSIVQHVIQYGKPWTSDKVPDGFSKVGIQGLENMIFDSNTAGYIQRTIEPIVNEKAMMHLIQRFAKAQDAWKLMATSINPGFHMRNFYSNMFLGWTWLGLPFLDPKNHTSALKMMRLADKTPMRGEIAKIFGESEKTLDDALSTSFAHGKTLRELFDFLDTKGIFKRGFSEVLDTAAPDDAFKAIKGTLGDLLPWRRTGFQARAGEWLGNHVESTNRVAAFLARFKQTGSMQTSFDEMMDVFVNYQLKTPFERQFGGAIVPFWTWMKQNTANQIKFVFIQPGRYGKIGHFRRAMELSVDDKVPDELEPAYYDKLWMFQLPINMPDGRPLYFNPNLPFQDLNKLTFDPRAPYDSLKGMFREVLSAASPFIKAPLEMIPKEGYDIFRQAPIIKYEGQVAPVPGAAQPIAKVMAENFPEIAETLGVKMHGDVATMGPKAAHLMTTLVPLVNSYGRVLMNDPTKEKFDEIFSAISYVAGIKVKPLDLMGQKYYKLLQDLEERREYWRERGYSRD